MNSVRHLSIKQQAMHAFTVITPYRHIASTGCILQLTIVRLNEKCDYNSAEALLKRQITQKKKIVLS